MSEQKIVIRTEADRRRLMEFFANLDLTKPWRVEWKRHMPGRSLNANGLYWKWMTEIAQATENDKDLVHEFFKVKFCPTQDIEFNGEFVDVRSTAKLDKREMSEYMERVAAFVATDLGVYLTHPDDQHMR